MSTGDLQNNLSRLRAELKSAGYKPRLETASISAGEPGSFLLILHFLVCDFSIALTAKVQYHKGLTV
jgi:hypothetical protein